MCVTVRCAFGLCCHVKIFEHLLFILFLTMHHKTNFLVNLYWDNNYSDHDYPATWAAAHHLQRIDLYSGGWTLLCKEFIVTEGSPHITMQHITF